MFQSLLAACVVIYYHTLSFDIACEATTMKGKIRLYLHVSSSYHAVRDEWWPAAAAGQVRPPLAARSR